MLDIRSLLQGALSRVAEGGDITYEELFAIIPPDRASAELAGLDAKAYWALWGWADDADIRKKEPDGRYADFRREQLRDIAAEYKRSQD